MDRLTRKELKTDKFAEEVGVTVEYVAAHRRQVKLYGGITLAILLAAAGIYYFRRHQHEQRQQALNQVFKIQQAAIRSAPVPGDPGLSFPTREARNAALEKALNDVAGRFGSSDEGHVAQYMLGLRAADNGKFAEAEKRLKPVAEDGPAAYASLAKFTLAQIYQSEGKTAEAEKMLRALVEKPTLVVSKEQASIELAKLIARSKPDEARKLLEPLQKSRSAVTRNVTAALAELPRQQK